MGKRRDFVGWARERAIHVDLGAPLDGSPLDASPLSALDPLLSGKRIAYLGEANHFIHEKYAYRLLFLKHLVRHGFRCVGEELAHSDGQWIDRFLASGDETNLDRVAAYGDRRMRRADRDDTSKGVLGELLENQPEAALSFEQRRFDRALRCLSQGLGQEAQGEPALRFFGFDVDYEAGAGYAFFDSRLERDREVDGILRETLARVPGESQHEEAERLHRAVAVMDARKPELEGALGEPAYRAFKRAVRMTAISHEYAHLAHSASSFPALAPAMALREQLMAEQLAEVLASRGPDDKHVLLSHNLHLAREDAGIRTPASVVGPGGGILPSLGCALARERPDEIFVVWMLEATGRDASPLPGWSGRVSSSRRSLNRLLARVGDAFALPIRTDDPEARLLRDEVEWMSMNGVTMRTVMPEQADVLFFVREVTPLQSA